MNLIKNPQRLMEMAKLKLTPANPPSPLHHFSSFRNRESILKNGLIPKIGQATQNWQSHNEDPIDDFVPMIFAQNLEYSQFFNVYGNDCWEIDLSKFNNKWFMDPIHPKSENWNHEWFVTLDPIPPNALKLISSDEKEDRYTEYYQKYGDFPDEDFDLSTLDNPDSLEKIKEHIQRIKQLIKN
jgi:hypothetical protein